MADTKDLRSEGKRSRNPHTIRARAWYNDQKSQGLCVTCGTEPVKNRVECYMCGKRKKIARLKSKVRQLDRRDPDALLDVLEELGFKLDGSLRRVA